MIGRPSRTPSSASDGNTWLDHLVGTPGGSTCWEPLVEKTQWKHMVGAPGKEPDGNTWWEHLVEHMLAENLVGTHDGRTRSEHLVGATGEPHNKPKQNGIAKRCFLLFLCPCFK